MHPPTAISLSERSSGSKFHRAAAGEDSGTITPKVEFRSTRKNSRAAIQLLSFISFSPLSSGCPRGTGVRGGLFI